MKILWLFPILLAAIFSDGYHHPDEHFQILEFAKFRLGESPAHDLPWEFEAKIRPAAQPILAMASIEACRFFGIENSFWQVRFLRILTALLWIGLVFSWFRVQKKLNLDEVQHQQIFQFALLIWFVPYCLARFSSENWSALLFWSGIVLSFQNSRWQLFFAGALLGLSFFFRFQMGIALAGFFGWLIYEKHIQKLGFQWFITGGLAAMALGFSADRWFYGEWICTPLRYFQANILEGKASEFGEEGLFFYPLDFLGRAIPPVSLLLLVGAVFNFWKRKIDPQNRLLLWIFVPFFVGHLFISHKELRFLFPMILPFVGWATAGVFLLFEKFKNQIWWRWLWRISLTVNFLALIFVCFQPAADTVPMLQFLDQKCAVAPRRLWVERDSPYCLVGVKANFYEPKNLEIFVLDEWQDLPTVRVQPGDFFLFRKPAEAKILEKLPCQRVFSRLPEWVRPLNFGGWQERSKIWEIWEVR